MALFLLCRFGFKMWRWAAEIQSDVCRDEFQNSSGSEFGLTRFSARRRNPHPEARAPRQLHRRLNPARLGGSLQQRLELACIAVLDKKAIRVVAIGQRDSANVYALLSEPAGERLRRFLAAAVSIGIKGQVDGSRTVT